MQWRVRGLEAKVTAHELARKLLEGPDVPVVTIGREPNDDLFDEVVAVEPSEAWQVRFTARFGDDLHREPPLNPKLQRRAVRVRVIR